MIFLRYFFSLIGIIISSTIRSILLLLIGKTKIKRKENKPNSK